MGTPSPVAALVLSLLRERDMHPYEVLATLRARRSDRLVRLNPGSIYHAVEKLAARGLIEAVGVDREGNRPERTTYHLTDAGRAALAQAVRALIDDLAPEYPRFSVALSLVHDLPAEDAVAHLTRRRAALDDAARQRRTVLEALLASGLPRRVLLDVEHDVHQREAEIAWLGAVLADAASGALDWTASPPDGFRHPFPLETM